MSSVSSPRTVHWSALGYGVLSFVHFAHNARYLSDYPGLPASWTAAGVMISWIPVALLGGAGSVLYARGHARAGLLLLAVFGLLGFGGLLHYARAPASAHSAAMNVTIVLEALGALLLLGAVACAWRAARPNHPPTAPSTKQ